MILAGNYGAWGQWGTCDCDSGNQTRSRSCNNPPPRQGGSKCVKQGNAAETKSCDAFAQDCPGMEVKLF